MKIKSTKVSTKFARKNKIDNLDVFIQEYQLVIKQFINILWNQQEVPVLIPKSITSQVTTWLSARAIQSAAKQASGIVRGTRTKQNKRLYVYNKLLFENKTKQAKKLKKIIDEAKVSKPDVSNVCPELDSRFIKIDLANSTTFDGWVVLASLGNNLKIKIPFKKTKHFNKLYQQGKIKSGIRLSKKSITFNFEMPDVPKKSFGQTVGLDIGILNTFTLSTGVASQQDSHGHSLQTINQKLSRKQKGSKSFHKAQQHRANYINWSLNQINFDNIKTLKIENIKNLRKGKQSSRYLSHFTYAEIFNKLDDLADQNGVRLEKVNPTYTSQRCSSCGWVRSSNRKGKQFKCGACKFKCDSDYNAAVNIATDLPFIGKAERLKHKNRKGFYWNPKCNYVLGKEFIVSSTRKI